MAKMLGQTYSGKRRKRSRSHGFLSRARTAGGRAILRRRRRKGRHKLAA